MDSIFTKIINKEIPAYIIEENDEFIAFLDAFPITKGHTLVVPKKQVSYIFDIEDDLFMRLHLFSKKIAKAIDVSIECERVGTVVLGLEVPHTHIHLVPINNVGDICFSKPKLKLDKSEFEAIQTAIKKYLD